MPIMHASNLHTAVDKLTEAQKSLDISTQAYTTSKWDGVSSPPGRNSFPVFSENDNQVSRWNSGAEFTQSSNLDALLDLSIHSCLFPADCQSIHDAAEAGDVGSVEAFLRSGVKIDSRREGDGETPLSIAARGGHQLVCETLLSEGADANATSSAMYTPLHEAAVAGKAACCQLLLMSGADANVQGFDGNTPLHLAAGGGHTAVVRLLLTFGASHAVTTSSDDTPLHVAADRGHRDVCRVLLQHGAMPSARNCYLSTPLHFCAEKGHSSMARLLLDHGACASMKDDERQTPLMIAARGDSQGVLRAIIKKVKTQKHENIHRLLEQADLSMHTALHWACLNSHLGVVETLLSEGANVDSRTRQRSTPLHLATQLGQPRVVEVLLERGAALDADVNGFTLLHVAAYRGLPRETRLLLDCPRCSNEVIDAEDKDGRTAVRLAAMRSHREVLQLLLCHGAQLTFHDTEGDPVTEAYPDCEDLVASPPPWSVDAHSKFPRRFRTAVRALLVAAVVDNKALKPCGLGRLPYENLLLVAKSMVHPIHVWTRRES